MVCDTLVITEELACYCCASEVQTGFRAERSAIDQHQGSSQ